MIPRELKKILFSHGFEIYRSLSNGFILAERERENLIMDSGITIICDPKFQILVRFKAEKSAFPFRSSSFLFDQIEQLSKPLREYGFSEISRDSVEKKHGSFSDEVLDTFYELTLILDVEDETKLLYATRLAMATVRRLPEEQI